jgi:hypothetical protein
MTRPKRYRKTFVAGVRVYHDVFGPGLVVAAKANGLGGTDVQVKFDGQGVKHLDVEMAGNHLVIVDNG